MRISTKTIAIIALAVLVSTALVGTSFLAGFGIGWFVPRAPQPTPVARGPEEFELFWETWEIVEQEFYGELPAPQEFTDSAIRGALSSLDDPATILVKPKAAADQMIELEGTYEGIGALVGVDKEERIVIVAPFDGSPAIQAGIMAGDVILKVGDTMVTGMPLEDAVRLIRGPKGTKVQLTVLREGEPDSLVFEITRDRVELVTVAWRVIDAIGYIRIAVFSERTSGELEKALRELREEEIEGLILDLRNNPGGVFPSAAIEVTSQFLEEGIIVYERDKDGQKKPYSVKGGGLATEIPLVVLVNKGSASNSEVVAGAIQDHTRGVLIGEKTFGKGSVQRIHELSDGSGLYVTTTTLLTPNRHPIHEEGLTPDIEVPFTKQDLEARRDPQLERALEYLKTGR